MNSTSRETVLVVGASGLVGTAAARAFAEAGWHVIAASRRAPELLADLEIRHLALDLQDAAACRHAARELAGVTHVVYAAVYELPGLMPGWSDPEQIGTNGRMLENLMRPLAEIADLQHVTLLQGTKAYGAAVRPMRIPARESQPRVAHPNFYWLQEDFLVEQAARCGYAWTILRPQLIVGPNHGVVMNLPPVIGAYAALRHHEGRPFSFPGGTDWVWEAVDVRLVGRACVWAAESTAARNETFNMTNGEVFCFRDMWPALAQTLGVAVGPDESLSVAAYLGERSDAWREVVRRYDLAHVELPTLLGESHHYADLCFNYGGDAPPPPTFVSTVKIKQAGFTEVCNTEESFCHWLADLQNRRVLPRL
ncbi:MAG: NAD-dependent epimerase/dehydratase family protein [Pseudomonadales bacterium]|jgi:nucleoside-diphosphate-sugar epimerase